MQPEANAIAYHSAGDFAAFFADKVARIRSSTVGSPPPEITHRSVPEPLVAFDPVTVEEVILRLKKAPSKHCRLDPAPTWLVKKVDVIIAPIIARMCNASFAQCTLPVSQKRAVTRPILKKPSLDPLDLNSYRPISNLSFVWKMVASFVSKMVERVVDSRQIAYCDII